MSIAAEFKEVVKYAWESAPVRMVENANPRALKALKAYLKMNPGIIDDELEKYPGYTLLHVAASHGNLAAAAVLIEKGAAIDKKTESGATPLALALLSDDGAAEWEDRKKLAEMLLKKGADIETRFGYDNQTILQNVFSQKQAQEASFLIENGADPLAAPGDHARMTPLMLCLQGEDSEALLNLGLAKGMDANAKNLYGMTPLFYTDSPKLALRLIKAGADPHHIDDQGRHALSGLSPEGRREVLDQLEREAAARAEAAAERKTSKEKALDDACHAPVTADLMKPLKLKKRAARPTTS